MTFSTNLSLMKILTITTTMMIATVLQACGGDSGKTPSNGTSGARIEDDKPIIFFMFDSKKETDTQGRDIYYSFVGEEVAFPRHFFSNADHTSLDVSDSYWRNAAGDVIQDNNHTLKLADEHKPSIKACMLPKLSNGKTNDEACVEFEVRDLPGLAEKLSAVSILADNDHFQAGIQLSQLEANDIRMIEGTAWQYRWLDKDSNFLQKSGDAIYGYKLNYADIDEGIKSVKTCVFDIVTQQCVKESSLVEVPANNVPTVTILDITGEYKQYGRVSPESRTSYEYTKPAGDFNYRWSVAGVELSVAEETASELILKDASYFGTDVTVCMQRPYKNFVGDGTTLTAEVCKTRQFVETDVQVTASYQYGHNLLAQAAPLVFSGRFNGIEAIDYSTFQLRYQGQLLTQNADYSISTFGHNDFTFKIHSQHAEETTEYGPILQLSCEFTYKSKQYSCIGGSTPSSGVSIYAHGLPTLKSRVTGTIAEQNRISFLHCEAGDKLTWWLKDEGSDTYLQTGEEETIDDAAICYGNAADGSLYLHEGWAGKALKLVVKRARNGLADERIQVLNIELGEISE